MSDTLRTRIEDVLCDHEELAVRNGVRRCCCGWEGEFPYASHKEHMADAVIRELGLEPERRVGPGEPGEGLSGFIRYASRWEVDD